MSKFDYLHEVEVASFTARSPRPLIELLGFFKSQGFTLHDDVVSLDRKGKLPPWQHSSIVEVQTELQGEEVFGFEEGSWDCLKLKYLFASLPFELVDRFIRVVENTRDFLSISPEFLGKLVSGADLKLEFEHFKKEVVSEIGDEPGSESLAIFIQTTYPRI